MENMTFAEAQTRHEALAEEIRRHDHAYYVLAQPSISDQAYDRLYRELLNLEAAFPALVTPESPSQRVGGAPVKEFKPVPHLEPMLSLDNTYSQGEVRDFVNRVQRFLPGEALEWVVEPKIDGLAVNLRYEHGVLTCGSTRVTGSPGTTSRPTCAPFGASRRGCARRLRARTGWRRRCPVCWRSGARSI